MGTIKKIGAIILFVFGGFFAIATIKMIFIDILNRNEKTVD